MTRQILQGWLYLLSFITHLYNYAFIWGWLSEYLIFIFGISICCLCSTGAASKQTLPLHADGKKHRAKARAFHASQKQSTLVVKPTSNEETNGEKPLVNSIQSDGLPKDVKSKDELNDSTKLIAGVRNEVQCKEGENMMQSARILEKKIKKGI